MWHMYKKTTLRIYTCTSLSPLCLGISSSHSCNTVDVSKMPVGLGLFVPSGAERAYFRFCTQYYIKQLSSGVVVSVGCSDSGGAVAAARRCDGAQVVAAAQVEGTWGMHAKKFLLLAAAARWAHCAAQRLCAWAQLRCPVDGGWYR